MTRDFVSRTTLLGRSAPCVTYIAREGSSTGRASSPEQPAHGAGTAGPFQSLPTAVLPFPGSLGLAIARHALPALWWRALSRVLSSDSTVRGMSNTGERSEPSSAIGWGGVWLRPGGTERGRRLGEPGRSKHCSERSERSAQQVPGPEPAGAFWPFLTVTVTSPTTLATKMPRRRSVPPSPRRARSARCPGPRRPPAAVHRPRRVRRRSARWRARAGSRVPKTPSPSPVRAASPR